MKTDNITNTNNNKSNESEEVNESESIEFKQNSNENIKSNLSKPTVSVRFKTNAKESIEENYAEIIIKSNINAPQEYEEIGDVNILLTSPNRSISYPMSSTQIQSLNEVKEITYGLRNLKQIQTIIYRLKE